LLGSGTILREVIAAADMLEADFGVPADVWSVTSFSELRREGLETDRWNRLHPQEEQRMTYVAQCLGDREGPFIAASDYMKIVPDQIRGWVRGNYVVLGTDGYGRSDTRAALREHFEVNRNHIVVTALKTLADEGKLDVATVAEAIDRLGVDPDRPDPVSR
jgi:pyruvate dehydrogenase E1 component